jgi:hypothetical protein
VIRQTCMTQESLCACLVGGGWGVFDSMVGNALQVLSNALEGLQAQPASRQRSNSSNTRNLVRDTTKKCVHPLENTIWEQCAQGCNRDWLGCCPVSPSFWTIRHQINCKHSHCQRCSQIFGVKIKRKGTSRPFLFGLGFRKNW